MIFLGNKFEFYANNFLLFYTSNAAVVKKAISRLVNYR